MEKHKIKCAIGVSGPRRGVYRASRRRGSQGKTRRQKKNICRGYHQEKTKTR